jgi:ERCC4-type nuclease
METLQMAISLIIDSREKLDKVQPLMDKIMAGGRFDNIKIEYKALKYGDYRIDSNGKSMLIERKAVADFCSNYGKGDLKEKLWHMRQEADRAMLMIEGRFKTFEGKPDLYLYRGSDLTPEIKIQTYVRFLTNEMERETWIYFTHSRFESLLSIMYLAENMEFMQNPKPSIKCGNPRELLIQIPGVGEDTIKKLQMKYKTPMDALIDLDSWANKTVKEGLNSW